MGAPDSADGAAAASIDTVWSLDEASHRHGSNKHNKKQCEEVAPLLY